MDLGRCPTLVLNPTLRSNAQPPTLVLDPTLRCNNAKPPTIARYPALWSINAKPPRWKRVGKGAAVPAGAVRCMAGSQHALQRMGCSSRLAQPLLSPAPAAHPAPHPARPLRGSRRVMDPTAALATARASLAMHRQLPAAGRRAPVRTLASVTEDAACHLVGSLLRGRGCHIAAMEMHTEAGRLQCRVKPHARLGSLAVAVSLARKAAVLTDLGRFRCLFGVACAGRCRCHIESVKSQLDPTLADRGACRPACRGSAPAP